MELMLAYCHQTFVKDIGMLNYKANLMPLFQKISPSDSELKELTDKAQSALLDLEKVREHIA